MYKEERKLSPTFKKFISLLVAFALVMSCIVVGIPGIRLRARADENSGNSGTLYFKDADIDYDSNLVENADGTYSLTLDFSSSVTQKDKNVSRTVSGDGYYVAPMNGYYTIQLWGGDGAPGSDTTFNRGGTAGKGGYVYTAVYLEKGDIVSYRLGGEGKQTLKTDEGGGVNGDGGNHGEIGSFYIGGGGGYSIAYIFKNDGSAKNAQYFLNTYTDGNGNLIDINTETYEGDRLDPNQYILVAGGGGGGGAGDRLNAEQIAQLIFNKPNGNADGGAGGSIGNATYDAIVGGNKVGTIYAGIDGSSSGKNKGYIGHGGTDVPGEAPEGKWQIIDAESPNNWDKSALADKTIEGGTGASGNLRGGGGGAGYTGGSGGMMTSLVNATNVGGGGGGASFVTSINPAVIGLDATELTETEKNTIKNAKNPREKVNNLQGGYIAINLLDEDTDDSSITWIKNELSFSTEISKYFTIENIDATNVTVTPDGSNANKITLDKFEIATKGDSKVVLTLKPIAGFAGGNDVNIFKKTSGAEIEADLGSSGQNLLGAKYDIDLDNDHAYVNVPLEGFKIKAAAEKKHEADQDISVAPLSLIDTANSVKEHGEPYDDFLDISSYKVNDADVDGSSANITTAGNYKVSFLVTPTAPTKATVGTPVVKTEFKATALISKKSPFSFNGVNFDMTKNLTYNASTNTYKYTLTLTTQDTLTFKQVSADSYYSGKEFTTSTADKTYPVAIPGQYTIYAYGGNGGLGGTGNNGNNDGKSGGTGGSIAGTATFTTAGTINVTVGTEGAQGIKADSSSHCGNTGVGGTASTVSFGTTPILIAGGGGGGAGYGLLPSSLKNDENVAKVSVTETSYNETAHYYDGQYYEAKDDSRNSRYYGEAGKNYYNPSVISTISAGTNTQSPNGYVKIVPAVSKKTATEIETQFKNNSGLANIDISVLDISKYFSDVILSNVNANATVSIVDKNVTPSTEGGYSVETTTGKVSKTWTFEFTPDSKFLGGYDVPVLDQQIVLKHSGTSETAKVTAGANASGVMTDYANVKISDPKSLDTVTAEKKVIFGTNVKENELITVTGSYDGYDAEFVNVTDSKFATLGNTLPVDAKADETFTYKTGVAPKADSSVLANVGPTLVKTEDEAESTVTVIGYAVTQTLSNLNSTYTGTTVGLDEDIELTLSPKSNAYVLPDTITVKVGGETLDVAKYSYDKSSGKVSIDSSVIDAGVQIIATAADFVPEVYTFHLVYNKDGKSISQEFQYESGTALTANAIGSSTSVKAAMDAAKLDVGTASKGYTFVWDWPDGELSTMPAQDFWLFGSLEPYTYTMYADCECSSVNIGKATDLAWYTKEGAVVAPAIEGYILTSASNSIAYNINEAFIDSHDNGAEVKVGTFTYKVATNEYTVQYVRDLDVETEAVNVANKPTIKAYDEYVAAKITVNGEDLPTVSFDSYTPADGDVVVITYKALLHAVTMIDAETGEELGTIQVEKGGFYNGLAKSDEAGKVGEWYYDAECTNKIHTRDSEFTKEDYANGTVDVEKDKIYVKWVDGTFIVTYDANGGSFDSGVSNTVEVTYGSGTKAYGDSEVKRSGYSVKKWLVYNLIGRKVAEVNPGADISKLTEIADEELTLVAEWIPDIIVNATYKPGTTTETYASGTWVNKNVDIALSNGLGYGLDKVSYYYSTDNGTNWTLVADGTTPTDKMTVSTTATYLFKIVATDGTEFDTESINVNIDKVAPTGKIKIGSDFWDSLLTAITFGIYKNDNYTITIEAQDETNGSGIAEVYYYVDADPSTTGKTSGTLDGETFTKLEGTYEFTVPKASLSGDKRVAYARIVDNAGNVAYISTNGVEFDYENPSIKVNGETMVDGTVDEGKGERDVVVSDKYIDKVVIKDDEGTEITSIVKTVDPTTGDITFTLPADEPGTYVVVATDKSGNTTTYTLVITGDDLKDKREELIEEVENLPNLTEEEKEELIDELEKADTSDELDDIYDKAVATNFVEKYCKDDDGIYTDEGSNPLITNPVDTESIDQVLSGESDYGELSDNQKEYVKELVSDPEGAYEDYPDMLADAKNAEEAIKENAKNDIEDAYKEAKEKIESLDPLENKDELLQELLDEKNNAEALIDNAGVDDIDDIIDATEAEFTDTVDDGIAENFVEKYASDNDGIYDKDENEIGTDDIDKVLSGDEPYGDLTENQKDKVNALIDDGTDDTFDNFPEMLEAAEDLFDDEKDKVKEDLEKKAEDAIDEIENNPDLDDDQKEDLIDEIEKELEDALKDLEDADTLDDVEEVVDEFEDELEDTLDDAIAQGFVDKYCSGDDNDPYDKTEDLIDEDNAGQVASGKQPYENLTPEQKDKVNEIISTPTGTETTYDNYLSMLEDAEKILDEEKQKAIDDLEEEAEKAKDAIDDLNIPEDEKQKLKDEIDEALEDAIDDILDSEDKEGIDEIVDGTEDDILDSVKEGVKEELEDEAEKAKDYIDSLENLTDKEKQDLKDKIDQIVDDMGDEIDGDDSLEDILKDLEDALEDILDETKKAAKEELEKEAQKAKDEIDDMDGLTEEQKKELKDEIDNALEDALDDLDDADTLDKIKKIVDDTKDEFDDILDKAAAQKFVNEYCSGDDNDPYDKTDDKLDLDNIKQVISGKDSYDGLTENQKKFVDEIIKTKTGDEETFDSYEEMLTASQNIIEDINGKNSDGEDNIRVEVKVEGLMEFDNKNATSVEKIKEILTKEIEQSDVDVIVAGGHVEIVMTIKEIEKDEINEKAIKADGNVLVSHTEITIVKTQYDKDGKLIEKKTITNTSEPISFVVSVKDYEKEGRVFYVYADHTGKTVAEKTPDGDGVLITPTVAFTTDEFSVFSIAYEKEDKIAQTLDNTPIVLPLVMLVSSAIIFVIAKRKKDNLVEE